MDYINSWESYETPTYIKEEQILLDAIAHEIRQIINHNDEQVHITALNQLVNAFLWYERRYVND